MYDVDVAKYQKGLAKSSYHPKVDLEFGASYDDELLDDADKGKETYLDVKLKMNWNVFNSFADLNAVRAAGSRVNVSRQNVMDFMNDLEREMEDTYSQYGSAQEQYEFYRQATIYNRQTRAAYLQQFTLGARSLSDILDVESEYFSSSTEELTAKGNITVGAYRILALSGKLVDTLGIDESIFDSMNLEEVTNVGLDF